MKQIVIVDDTKIKFEIWDTAGQERYRSLAPMYYRGAACAVIVFDVTNKETFTGAKSWVRELQRRGDPNVVIALAGNKADSDSRAVEAEEARTYAQENGLIYMETSAKTGMNVRELFIAVAQKLPKSPSSTDNLSIPISPSAQEDRTGCC